MMFLKQFIFAILILVSGVQLSYADKDAKNCRDLLAEWKKGDPIDSTTDKFAYPALVRIADPRVAGKPFFNVVRDVIKPLSGYIYENGVEVVSGSVAMKHIYGFGVKMKAKLRKQLNDSQIKFLFDELHKLGPLRATEIAPAIAKVGKDNPTQFPKRLDIFDLANDVGFISGHGVAIEIDPNNFLYNIFYDALGIDAKAVQTGRTAVNEEGGLNDPSDQQHLTAAGKMNPEEALAFLETSGYFWLTSTAKGYENLTPLAADVFDGEAGVGVAEELRDLIDNNLKTQPWGKALLHVSDLIASYHSALTHQSIMYADQFLGIPFIYTNRVYNQYGDKAGNLVERDANVGDYTQRGNSPGEGDLKRTNRSGPNITMNAQKKLTGLITQYVHEHNPKLVSDYATAMGSKGQNLYEEWIDFVISFDLPSQFEGAKVEQIMKARQAFFKQVQKDANKIDAWIKTQVPTELPKVDLSQAGKKTNKKPWIKKK